MTPDTCRCIQEERAAIQQESGVTPDPVTAEICDYCFDRYTLGIEPDD